MRGKLRWLGSLQVRGSREKAEEWKLKWGNITPSFDIKAKPVHWLGFFIGCRFNWQAHVRHRLVLDFHRIRTVARVMNANGILRKLARKMAWAVAMSTATYGIEEIREGQQWLLDGSNKLTTAIGRAVAGTFSTAKGRRYSSSRYPPDSPGLRSP
jgi:hypothetical protein